MSSFKQNVIKRVQEVPHGKVVSYGQVALACGQPRGARGVGWILNKLEGSVAVPWWRVINNSGRITIRGSSFTADDQKRELELEGVKVSEDYVVDMNKYRHEF